jgi:hypothetical protein
VHRVYLPQAWPFKIRNRLSVRKRRIVCVRQKHGKKKKKLMSTRKDDVAVGKTYSSHANDRSAPHPPLGPRPPPDAPQPHTGMTEMPIPGLQATARPTHFRSYPQLVKLPCCPCRLLLHSGGCGYGRSHGGVIVIRRVVWVTINTDTQ